MRLTALAAFFLLSSLAAQTPPTFAINDTNTTLGTTISSFGFSAADNGRAWQITPTTTTVVQSAQFFTRNSLLTGSRFMRIEIWSDNSGLPGTRLGGGTWRIVNARPAGWQGANLDTPVVLIANTPAWVVWREPGSSVLPLEPGGSTVLSAIASGANWTAGAQQAPKIRLFANLLDSAHSHPFGLGCPLSSGTQPTVFTNEDPAVGNAGFFFETSGSPAGVPVILALGVDPAAVPFPLGAIGFPIGCWLNTDVILTVTLTSGTGNTKGPTCSGYDSFALALPNNPALVGQFIAAQSLPLDLGLAAALPFAASHAHHVVMF